MTEEREIQSNTAPKVYVSEQWLQLRDAIVSRDCHRCRNCGSHEKLDVHHWLPLPAYRDDVDGWGYARKGDPLLVHESGLVTLCTECHAALTSIRQQRAVLQNPRLQQLGRGAERKLLNIFQLWALAGEQVPFKVSRESWSDKVHQYYLVDRVEISKWPYGFAWGRYYRAGTLGETEKIRSAGTYAWRAVEEVAAAPVVAEGESPPR